MNYNNFYLKDGFWMNKEFPKQKLLTKYNLNKKEVYFYKNNELSYSNKNCTESIKTLIKKLFKREK